MAEVSLVSYKGDDQVTHTTTTSPDGDSATSEGTHEKAFYNSLGVSIPAGDWVELDTSVTGDDAEGNSRTGRAITNTATTADDPLVVGVAAEAIAATSWGRVRVWGPQAGVKVASGTATDVALQKVATAGEAGVAAATTERRTGLSLTAESGGTATVFIRCYS